MDIFSHRGSGGRLADRRMTHYERFEDIPLFHYDLIMADPPWLFKLRSEKGEKKSAQAQYDCMLIDDIRKMRVGDLAASTGCILWLWCTNPMLPEGISTLEAWNFKFITAGSWAKKTPDRIKKKTGCVIPGKYRWGGGYVLRSTNEPYLIGRIGDVRTSNRTPGGFDGVAREHSRKPEKCYALAEQMIVGKTDIRRLDLFSRTPREGWDTFGLEADKFDPV